MMAHVHNPSYSGHRARSVKEAEILCPKIAPGHNDDTLSEKYTEN
jgi:hypothetical protein